MEILELLWSHPLLNTPQLNRQLNYSAISSQPHLQNSTTHQKFKVRVTLRLAVYRQSVRLGEPLQ
jgi:hypothetical protein